MVYCYSDGAHFTFVGYKSGQVETDKTDGKKKRKRKRKQEEQNSKKFKLRKAFGGQYPNWKPEKGKHSLAFAEVVLKDSSPPDMECQYSAGHRNCCRHLGQG